MIKLIILEKDIYMATLPKLFDLTTNGIEVIEKNMIQHVEKFEAFLKN